MIKLVYPSDKYKKSFLEAAKEHRDAPDKGRYGVTASMEEMNEAGFRDYVKKKLDNSKGINVSAGYVPATEYWLVDGDEYIGRVSIRHTLNENLKKLGGHIGYTIRPSKRKMGYGTKILALALVEAKKLGIKKALVTCDKDNLGSVKIIEKNGGILEDEIPQGEEKSARLRYWIEIK